MQTVVQRWVEKNLFFKLHGEITMIATSNLDNFEYIRRLNLADEQIKLCDRFSRYEPILVQALTQLESQSKDQRVDAIGCAIANLRYLLGKSIEYYSTETAGVPHSNGTPLSDGRNAREAYPPNKLDINVDRILSTHDIILP